MEILRAMFRLSERFACRVVGQHRSMQRHAGMVVDIEEAMLRRRLREIAAEYTRIRFGRWISSSLPRPMGSRLTFLMTFLNVIDEHIRLCLAIRVGSVARPRMWWWCWRS